MFDIALTQAGTSLYCLAKGTVQSIKVNKQTFKNNSMFSKGRLVFCNKFTKDLNDQYILSDYKYYQTSVITGWTVVA